RSASSSPAQGQWFGVRLVGSGTTTLRGLEVRHVRRGLTVQGTGTLNLSDAHISTCSENGITAPNAGASVNVTSSRFSSGACGISLTDGTHSISYSIFEPMSGTAIAATLASQLASLE